MSKPTTSLAGALLAGLVACTPTDDGRASASETTTTSTSTTASPTSSSTTATASTSSAGGSEGATEGTSSSGTGTTGTSAVDSTGATGLKLDVGPDTGGPVCPPDDICCKKDGEIPPHKLLDAFLAVYPPANMPKSVAAVQAFEPVADGHMMAWSNVNVGNELVDAGNGGVIEANIQAGRDLSRMAAEMAVPVDATLLEIREDPVIIEDLGTNPPCIGVGWGWGSLLFENADQSIGELVYLYVGFCSDGDVERFYYSDQAVEICPPPG